MFSQLSLDNEVHYLPQTSKAKHWLMYKQESFFDHLDSTDA